MKGIEQFKASINTVIVKIYNRDKEIKNTSESGLITTNIHRPMMNACQVGKVISVGNNADWIKKDEIVLFHHVSEDDDQRFLGRDEEGEYRIVKEGFTTGEIFGVIKKNKSGYSHIIPKKHYLLCEPKETDFEMTSSVFQIPVAAINPADKIARKMGIKVGDWVICTPYSAYEIWINRQPFWFLYLEDLLAINKGFHKIAVNRKHVSPTIRMASRQEKIVLN